MDQGAAVGATSGGKCSAKSANFNDEDRLTLNPHQSSLNANANNQSPQAEYQSHLTAKSNNPNQSPPNWEKSVNSTVVSEGHSLIKDSENTLAGIASVIEERLSSVRDRAAALDRQVLTLMISKFSLLMPSPQLAVFNLVQILILSKARFTVY